MSTRDDSRRASPLPGDAAVAALIRRAQRYDTHAFERLYDWFADAIYQYALYQHLSAHAATRLVSATFEQATREIGRFKLPAQNPARATRIWLLQIAVKQAVGYNGGEEHAADDAIERSAFARCDSRLLAALRRLPADVRQVVVLRLIGRMPLADVAAATGQPEATCRRAQMRALSDLAQNLYAGEVLRERMV